MSLILMLLLAQTAEADPLAAMEHQQQQLFERIAPGTVFISNGEEFGSGFFISSAGLILTNAHVVGDRQQVHVVLHDGRKAVGTVIERAKEEDLALVQIPVKNTAALELGTIQDVRVGSWVGAVGHGRGMVWTFNTGMISNIYPEGSDRPIFQTEIPVNPGSSGGPIFDRRGRVVGLVTAGILKDTNNLNFGYVIDYVRKKLKKLAEVCDCITVNAPDGVPVFINGTMAGTGPRVVVPASAGKVYEVFAVIGGQMKKAQARLPDAREVTLK